jgi:hypothetical protein
MVSMLSTITEGFNNASLQDSYAVMRTGYGGYQQSAGVGVYSFDGNGWWTGTLVANIAGDVFGARAQVRVTMEGTYTVDGNGSGYGSTRGKATFERGTSHDVTTTFLITRAEETDGTKRAQEISLMEDAVDPLTRALHMNQAIRHPDAGAFSVASLRAPMAAPGSGMADRRRPRQSASGPSISMATATSQRSISRTSAARPSWNAATPPSIPRTGAIRSTPMVPA